MQIELQFQVEELLLAANSIRLVAGGWMRN